MYKQRILYEYVFDINFFKAPTHLTLTMLSTGLSHVSAGLIWYPKCVI